jgi:redox-sensitive bicupin YhaK (pirin superfamily)
VHPHRGFETVTIAYEGQVSHHDSSGGGGTIGQGDVQWMTAASGVLHKEYHSEAFTRTGGYFQMVQLWVNLPAEFKMSPPKYQGILRAEMGHIPVGSSEVELIAGEFGDQHGPASTFSPVHLSNAYLNGDPVAYAFPDGFRIGVLAVRGDAVVNGTPLPQDHLAVLSESGNEFTLSAEGEATVLVFGGVDLKEPIAPYGPFVMNTTEELHQAIQDYNAGKFGVLAD